MLFAELGAQQSAANSPEKHQGMICQMGGK